MQCPVLRHQLLLPWWGACELPSVIPTNPGALDCIYPSADSSFGQWGAIFVWKIFHKPAEAIHFQVLSILAVETGWSCTVYDQHPYEAPRVFVMPLAKPSLSDILSHLSSNVPSKINLLWPDLFRKEGMGSSAKERLDAGIQGAGGMTWED